MSIQDQNRFAALAHVDDDDCNFVSKNSIQTGNVNKHPGGDPQGQEKKDKEEERGADSSASGSSDQISPSP